MIQLGLLATLSIFHSILLQATTRQTRLFAPIKLASLLQIASENRYDLKAADESINMSQANLSLQRAMAVPNMYLGYRFDLQGNYNPNYQAGYIQMDLPVFNRNQGNIKMAKAQLEQNKILQQQLNYQITNDVLSALNKTVNADRIYKESSVGLTTDYDNLFKNVMNTYLKKEISLLEFLDFFDSYKETFTNLYSLKNNRLQSFESINYSVGKKLFNY